MLWGGRFNSKITSDILSFSSSLAYDKTLFKEDILGTKAHVKMLCKVQLISEHDYKTIVNGLNTVSELWERGEWCPSPTEFEDIHSAVEIKLGELIGDVAGKIHTGRSRNDQVVTDMKLWMKKRASECIDQINHFQYVLIEKAKRYKTECIPSYTHLQQAQPISFGYHLMTYTEMLQRDKEQWVQLLDQVNENPLGSGAVAGSTLPLDRKFTTEELGFSSPTRHAMDAVSNRDFMVNALHYISVSMMHLSRLAEELILWSTAEFNWVRISDEYTTGSSLMPQKRNVDMAELIRGKVGRVYGNYISLMTTLKALPLAYNRDMQEDKEPVFDSFNTYTSCLNLMTGMIDSLTLLDSDKNMSEFMLATDLADECVKLGISFRESHRLIGEIVKLSERTGKTLKELQESDLPEHLLIFRKLHITNMNEAMNKKQTIGSCSLTEINRHIIEMEKRLDLSTLKE